MKKRGYSVIEVLIAMAIFLFGIFPIIGFTFTSLRGERIAGSKEEAARLTTTVVDYIKSRGYENVKTITGGGFDETYELVLKDDKSAFITKDYEFEDDFYGNKNEIFVLNSRGLRMEDGRAEFEVHMNLVDVELMKWSDTNGDGAEEVSEWSSETSYENVLTGTSNKYIYGETGINTQDSQKSKELKGDKFILGKVLFKYTEKAGEAFDKSVEMQFVISPIEEWR
ncbi:prepilin-type N-terminal cleavage/methylation domain-containing protein [uncultured Ilyobacter sp.]|uniref:type IV pilus modification PilV family protein n=1 Tax=uncultured Ilyobacter sp. TaxID=544433 RepID=UPI0029C83E79|nr:prepilin-type N-terminal cleavage/methylation domain-containing protein [uncultured Ilyobacter sp.]